jgi:predicted protein tyrosine phosphatase
MSLDDYAYFMHNLVVIVLVRNSESHVRNTNHCALIKVANSGQKPVTNVIRRILSRGSTVHIENTVSNHSPIIAMRTCSVGRLLWHPYSSYQASYW